MVYRSGREGFTQYVIGLFNIFQTDRNYKEKQSFSGQLEEIASTFYKLKLQAKVIEKASSESGTRNTVIVTYRLDFDNSGYVSSI